jgi:hypothetical protein
MRDGMICELDSRSWLDTARGGIAEPEVWEDRPLISSSHGITQQTKAKSNRELYRPFNSTAEEQSAINGLAPQTLITRLLRKAH